MAHPLLLPFPRPEYPAAPELLLASLAWRHFVIPELEEAEGKPVAVSYRRDTQRASRTLQFRTTEPSGQTMPAWEDALQDAGIDWTGVQAGVVGMSFADAIAGIRASKAKGQAAIPMTPTLAMLQNARGMTGKENPANYGLIIEQLYAHGNGSGPSAASQWLRAVNARLESDTLLADIDSAAASLLPGAVQERPVDPVEPTLDLGHETPFAWFATSWDKLTGQDWVEALPARRWTDWATSAIRLAVGMGYLWEASWYEALGRMVIEGRTEVEERRETTSVWGDLVEHRLRELVPWHDDAESVSVRDVSPVIKERIRRGATLRSVFQQVLPDDAADDPWDDLVSLADDEASRQELEWALARRDGTNPNTMETVRYALKSREESGSHADHYGLLIGRANNRYLLVQPATELLAMVASLAASGPSTSADGYVNLGDIAEELRRLGLQPSLALLTAHLERTGLARGSADADQAVLVSSAY